jgi:hypothetical protein
MRHSDTTQCTYREYNAIVLISILSDYIILQITSYILPYIHMYGMTHQKALKTGTIVATLLLTVSLATQQQQPVQASGLQDGQSEAEQDFMRSNGQDKDPGCSPENGVDYCTEYKLGYETKWAHMWLVFDCRSGVCQ